ncbi:MAG: hypothetical protein HUU35_07895, partial [Armatimonadetes bacterium]|nr:hypothetical protein [Armatimonadota bacterium]
MNRLERLENLSAYIDGELSEQEHRLLVAWCENHPEDLEHFEGLAEVVRQVRGLPQVEPPAGLREQILRAVAETEPVAATREQAIEWLDDYLDGELSEPRRAVVDHFLAVDAEFAELAEMQVAMLTALSDMGEAEPPADLRQRIEASVKQAGTAERMVRPRRATAPIRARRRLAVG